MHNQYLVDFCFFGLTNVNKKTLAQQLEGKSILITGASSGIGAQLAYELADFHCHLILVARRGEKLAEVKREVEKKNARVDIFQADLRNEPEMNDLLSFLHSLPNGLDIIVSNAGLSIKRSIYDSLDRFHDVSRTMAINHYAPVQLLLSTIPLLQKNRGQFINVSSINTLLAPVPYFAAYQASKSAFDIWFRSVSPELNAKGIVTTSIYFPLVKTPMIEPTVAYRNKPALSKRGAAQIICKGMYKNKKKMKPWWLLFGQMASIFLFSFWDFTKKR
ncbi:SDR family NAD(P)-dependent oxidoreductase [Ureibacillus acetophenoni]|uniref:Short-subunit dehydrogenase n=1 Tax=Ureibacillus acetophenoni TaxID=614649 RepID=A0A285U3X2_9BACL|nr:SDR family NAD(P)-dependent oxidoreductase [Ureibacillus acetophenoni]SOC36532.1 short-subunit dehydrogenase [Ureibacillus acetophenoni]